MLNPEIWNFKEPESSFQIQETEIDKQHLIANNLAYNHLVTVIVPDAVRLPETLTDILNTDCEYYKIHKLNLSALINKEFLTGFIRNGKLLLLSDNTRIDCDNCVAVTSAGHLVLNLDKDSYHSLGLEGKVSHFQKKIKSRYKHPLQFGASRTAAVLNRVYTKSFDFLLNSYFVTVDLRVDTFQEGKPLYEKTKLCLEKLGTFTLIVNWEPPSEYVCPSSIAKYFCDLGYKVGLCEPTYKLQTLYSVKVPDIDSSFNEVSAVDFVEWLGMVSVQGDLDTALGDYITTYQTPEPSTTIGQVKLLQWRGLFTSTKVEALMVELAKYTKAWTAVYVQGFSDVPISWASEENHFYTNGDTSYLSILKSPKCLICTQRPCRKRYK